MQQHKAAPLLILYASKSDFLFDVTKNKTSFLPTTSWVEVKGEVFIRGTL